MTTVLIVDDDADIRDLLTQLLNDAGYAVQEAADGLAAYDLLRASPERLIVLLDYSMPHLDGHQLLARLAAEPPLDHRHVYFLMTALHHRLPDALQRLLAHLCIPVLPKPFEVEEILQAVAGAASWLAAQP